MPIAIPPALGGLWREVLVDHPGARNALAQGIDPDPDAADAARRSSSRSASTARFESTRRLPARARSQHGGEVTRLYMNVWARFAASRGRLGRQSSARRARARRDGVRRAHVHAPARAARSAQRHAARRRGLSRGPRDALRRARADAPRKNAPDGARWLDELAPDPAELRVHARSDRLEPARQLARLRPRCFSRRRQSPARGGRPPLRRAQPRGRHRVSQAVLRGRSRARARAACSSTAERSGPAGHSSRAPTASRAVTCASLLGADRRA